MPAWSKTQPELEAMRQSGRILAEVLTVVAKQVKPGITTLELDTLTRREIATRGAIPSFLDYQGFPAAICISINEEVVHGIPSKRVIKDGDIVGLDLGVTYDRMITDAAVHVAAGKVGAEAERLMKATREALTQGIAAARAGNRVGDISAAIEKRLRADRLGVIEDLSGHGVGHSVHEEPVVPNFGRANRGPVLHAGMTLAIEPMATLGSKQVRMMPDGWTFVSADGTLTCQFEHTILITDREPEILTILS